MLCGREFNPALITVEGGVLGCFVWAMCCEWFMVLCCVQAHTNKITNQYDIHNNLKNNSTSTFLSKSYLFYLLQFDFFQKKVLYNFQGKNVDNEPKLNTFSVIVHLIILFYLISSVPPSMCLVLLILLLLLSI